MHSGDVVMGAFLAVFILVVMARLALFVLDEHDWVHRRIADMNSEVSERQAHLDRMQEAEENSVARQATAILGLST